MSRFLAAALSGLIAASLCTATAAGAARADVVQQDLNNLVHTGSFPGALAAVRGRDARVRNYTAGVGDLATKAKVPVDGQIRIASNTKTFVATVVLQLVGEGKVGLDLPIETYLPKLVRGPGIDGRKITVRQILQHTGGVPEYLNDIAPDFVAARHTYFEPRELLDAGLSHPASFPPGTGWEYSNTDYILAGLLVQKVTGRPIGEEITDRVINRIGLRHTYWPAVGEQGIRERHPHGYDPAADGTLTRDITELDPAIAWAAGALISTPGDVLTFLTALVDGRLLAPAQLQQMQTTVASPGLELAGITRYGLGLGRFDLSCGGYAWAHGGDIDGYETRSAVTADGRGAVVAVTALPTTVDSAKQVVKTLDDALCE